jgi:hypothetical protein
MTRFMSMRQQLNACGGGCVECTVSGLRAGLCAPGTYSYLYEVEDNSGNLAVRSLDVAVVQRGRVSTTMRFACGSGGDPEVRLSVYIYIRPALQSESSARA